MICSIHVLRALIQHSPDVLFAELAKLYDQQFAEVLKIIDAEDCIDIVQWINSKFSTRVEEILFLNTTEECLAFPTVKTHSKEPMRGNNQRLKMDVIGMKYTSKKQFEVLILCSFPDKPLNSLIVILQASLLMAMQTTAVEEKICHIGHRDEEKMIFNFPKKRMGETLGRLCQDEAIRQKSFRIAHRPIHLTDSHSLHLGSAIRCEMQFSSLNYGFHSTLEGVHA